MRITDKERACECRISERQASRESAKYSRRHSEGYILQTSFPLYLHPLQGNECGAF